MTNLRNVLNDYYWRDYTGDIPFDAVSGGLDINKKTTYIGQAFVKDAGIIPVEIHAGVKTVVANKYYLYTVDTYIKILCSPSNENFKWVPATAADLHLIGINTHLVAGGTEEGFVSHIGRVAYQNATVIGKVCSFRLGDAKIYFPYGKEEKNANSFEILVYEQKERRGNAAKD